MLRLMIGIGNSPPKGVRQKQRTLAYFHFREVAECHSLRCAKPRVYLQHHRRVFAGGITRANFISFACHRALYEPIRR
jgi:hypothetical protein